MVTGKQLVMDALKDPEVQRLVVSIIVAQMQREAAVMVAMEERSRHAHLS
jgi:hypothetical protein